MKIRRMVPILSCAAALLFSLPFVSFAQDDQEEELPATFAPAPQPQVELGRYRLFDGQYAVISLKGPEVAERHLFRIDTVTGTVWIGKQAQYVDRRTGKVIQQRYWELFEQYLEGPQAPAPNGR